MPTMSPPLSTMQDTMHQFKLYSINNNLHKNPTNTHPFPTSWPCLDSKWLQIPDCSDLESLPMTDNKFDLLRAWWQLQFDNVMAPAPEILPPMRGVNHSINLIDANLKHAEQHPTCPQALKDQL